MWRRAVLHRPLPPVLRRGCMYTRLGSLPASLTYDNHINIGYALPVIIYKVSKRQATWRRNVAVGAKVVEN